MALPTGTNYDTFSVPDPASDLTDVWVPVPLSQTSTDWQSAVDTTDPTKGRASKDDGVEEAATELPTDWSDTDIVNFTGVVWIKWTGTNSATASETLRLYPPKAANSSYASTATFGSEAVWSNHAGFYHFTGDPSGTAPQLTDATGGGNDGTTEGTMTSGDQVSGQLGDAWDFDETDDAAVIPDDDAFNLPGSEWMWSGWLYTGSLSGSNYQYFLSHGPFGNSNSLNCYITEEGQSTNRELFFRYGNLAAVGSGGTKLAENTWYHITVLRDASNNIQQYLNNSQVGVSRDGTGTSTNPTTDFFFGSREDRNADRFFGGRMDSFGLVKGASYVLADFRAYLYDSQSDPATFWGAGTWQGTGGAATEVSFSLDAAQQVASSSTAIAEAGISLNADADVSDGSTATGESDLPISHANQISTQSTSQAEGALSLSNLLQIAFDKQSVTDAAFSLPSVHQVTTVSDTAIVNEASFSLALQKAITTEQISTIEVSYSLNAAQQAAMELDATGEAAMSITLQAGLTLVSTALAEANISFNAVQSLTLTGQAVGVEVTLSDGRTLTIKLQNRTFTIADENRTFTIDDDNRTLNIDP